MVRPLLLLLCLATLAVSEAGKKCRDKKAAKGCVKKREKNFCLEASSCPKLKSGGRKCKKTRKSCILTCGLCTPDPINGEEACEGHGYGKARCKEVGCCQYAEGPGLPTIPTFSTPFTVINCADSPTLSTCQKTSLSRYASK